MIMRITSGRLLTITGLLHQAVGVVVGLGAGVELAGRNLFSEVARAGIVDSIGSDFARMTWFWFVMSGFLLLVLGGFAHEVERRGDTLPASLGWQIAMLSVAGIIFIPASGFWLLIPQGWWIVHKARQHRTSPIASRRAAT